MSATPPGTAREPPLERLAGTVERVTYHNEENGFSVLRMKVRGRRELVTVVGEAAAVSPGEFADCTGFWVNDRSHGLQFRARSLRVVPPSTLEGIEKYLGSGLIRGIGPHFARKLVRAFGEQVFDVIEAEPERLTELPGIGPKRRDQVVAAWAEQKVIREIMVFLQSHGVGTARAVRIYKTWGERAIELVRANPYRLALDIHGIGFQTADRIAASLGFLPESEERARAGVRHALQTLAGEGHTAVPPERLIEVAAALLEVDEALVERALEAEVAEELVVREHDAGGTFLALAPLERAESGIARHLARLLGGGPPPWGDIDLGRALPWVEARIGLTLSPTQRQAVGRAVTGKVTVITGGPGVGKTTIVNAILTIVRAKGARVVCAAPTGRAAKRLGESVGMEARTIHRLLEFDPRGGGFKHDADRPLEADLVVVDEFSMVDTVLGNQLLRAVPDTAAVLVVGDVDQLPSVGPGAVLADIIGSGRVPTVRLTEIHRQAEGSRIVVNAHRVHRGEMPERPRPGDEEGGGSDFYLVRASDAEDARAKLLELVTRRIPRRFGFDATADVQVLTPANRGGLGTRALNAELQGLLNAGAEPAVTRFGSSFAPGDKVIQTVNDYDKEVFNGDVGRVVAVDPEEGLLRVRFDTREVPYELGELDELSLAYAITVHKSQGSEYPAVVIPVTTQHYTMLERNLLYTAITRGRQLVVLVAEPRALAIAVKRVQANVRMTRLAARLQALLSGPPDAAAPAMRPTG